jgi:hypothetical protein
LYQDASGWGGIIREPEIGGEIFDRPGINQVWAGIKAHRWDVILAEESSRLYRHLTFASQFFDSAVDAGILPSPERESNKAGSDGRQDATRGLRNESDADKAGGGVERGELPRGQAERGGS